MQGWQAMAQSGAGGSFASLQHAAAAAIFLMEVTRLYPDWQIWKETDVSAVRCHIHPKPEQNPCHPSPMTTQHWLAPG